MTTSTTLAPDQRVRDITGSLIGSLQREYLSDGAHAVAALARLRRGAGKGFAEVPDLWGLVDVGPLHERPKDGGRMLSEQELTRAEDAVHVCLTLWALHQQSRGQRMHQYTRRQTPTGLGAAVRRLMPENDIAEPVLKRFVRAGNAPDLTALAQRLRDIVLLLRGSDIALDYALLAGQLYQWQEPGGKDTVRRAWGRSFHSYRDREAADPSSPVPVPTINVNDDDKDAS